MVSVAMRESEKIVSVCVAQPLEQVGQWSNH